MIDTPQLPDAAAHEERVIRLSALAAAAGEAESLLAVFRALKDFVVASTPCVGIVVSVYDPGTQRRTCAYHWNAGVEYDVARLPPVPPSHSPPARAIAEGRVIITPDLQAALQATNALVLRTDGQTPRSSIAVPMSVMGRIVGAFEALSPLAGAFTEEHLPAVRMAATLAGTALENVRLTEQERELRRAAESALRVRDEFLSVASHELRTPATAVRGYAQLLRKQHRAGRLDRIQLGQALMTLDGASAKLARLIDQLLDVCRVGCGKLSVDPRPTNLTALVDQVVAEARLRIDRHQIVVTAPPAVVLEVDPARMDQVLTNLLDNAIKYSPEGGRITLAVLPSDGELLITVADQGKGIPKEKRARIFERYFQAHSGNGWAGSDYSGLGIGLYVCQQIVELHRGTIQAEFPDEGGTRFVIRLPTP